MPSAIERMRALSARDRATSCVEWLGAKSNGGYGSFSLNGRRVGAHRAAFEIAYGPIPDGLDVCHRCDNPSCINPDHLFAGTRRENVLDMHAKGRQRHACGDDHPSAKLSWTKVASIRSDTRTHRAIAADYGVAHTVIGRIKRQEMWKRQATSQGGDHGVA
ncbi:MAG: HNH endonuclease signature motif containing protein [Reyranellaceae bacterium]